MNEAVDGRVEQKRQSPTGARRNRLDCDLALENRRDDLARYAKLLRGRALLLNRWGRKRGGRRISGIPAHGFVDPGNLPFGERFVLPDLAGQLARKVDERLRVLRIILQIPLEGSGVVAWLGGEGIEHVFFAWNGFHL